MVVTVYTVSSTETKVYVGNLGTGAGKGELERAFGYYGPLRTVWIARNPPGFAFVEFEDPRDADDAVRGLDGKSVFDTSSLPEHTPEHTLTWKTHLSLMRLYLTVSDLLPSTPHNKVFFKIFQPSLKTWNT